MNQIVPDIQSAVLNHEAIKPISRAIETHLQRATVKYFDEMGMRIRQGREHVLPHSWLSLYSQKTRNSGSCCFGEFVYGQSVVP